MPSCAVQRLEPPGVGHLHRVRDRDREDQERHQDRHRVEPEPEDRQQAEQPDHGHDRADERERRDHQRAGIPVQQQRRDDERDAEEHEHAGRALGDVADRLGEADDVDAGVLVLVLGADPSSWAATACRSRRSPVSGSFSISVATTIAAVWSFETMRPTQSDLSRFSCTFAICSGVPAKSADTHVAAAEAVLDDLGVAHVRGEQRRHGAALDAGDVEDLLGHLAQRVHELLVVDGPLLVLQRDQHLVGAAEVRLVLQEGRHVRVLQRDHLGERRLHAQLARHRAQQDGDQDEQDQQRLAVVEDPVGNLADPVRQKTACFSISASSALRRASRHSPCSLSLGGAVTGS